MTNAFIILWMFFRIPIIVPIDVLKRSIKQNLVSIMEKCLIKLISVWTKQKGENMRMANGEEKTILYYPTIRIKDGAWLRNALLYWDKVSSIVPGMNYDEFNSIEIEYLQDAGIYEPIYPFELEYEDGLCKMFCQQVKENLKSSKRSMSKRHTARVHVDKSSMVDRVHISKTPEPILDYLLEEGIAQRSNDGTWINMNSKDAEVYMATLAKYLAKVHGNTEIGTDISAKFFYPYARIKGNIDAEKQIYLNIALHEILPVPNMDVPLSDIIDFRKKYERELKCFRQRIEAFQLELNHCRDMEDIEYTTGALQRQMDDDLHKIEELMSSRGIIRTKKAMKILIPIAAATGIGLLAERVGIPKTGSALLRDIAGASVSLFCSKDDLRMEDKSAYLFYARKNGFISTTRSRSGA